LITVRELMKTHVQSLSPDETLQNALDRLDIYYSPCLPVVGADGRVVGRLTEDACSKRLWELLTGRASSSSFVQDLMLTDCMPIVDTTVVDLELAQAIVAEHPWLPVVDSMGTLVGTLHRIDVVQALGEGLITTNVQD
jgi:predicted transcriptional regulator